MPGRYHKHARKGGVPMHEWIVERPFDSADYLDGPPPSYEGSPAPDPNPMAPQASTTEGGAVSAVTEAELAVQEGLRDALASRERWKRWEELHGKMPPLTGYHHSGQGQKHVGALVRVKGSGYHGDVVKSHGGGSYGVRIARGSNATMAGPNVPRTYSHDQLEAMPKDAMRHEQSGHVYVSGKNGMVHPNDHDVAKGLPGIVERHNGDLHVSSRLPSGAMVKGNKVMFPGDPGHKDRSDLKWNARTKQLEGSYRGVKMEKGVAYQFSIGSSVHTARWDGTVDANGEPVFKQVDSGKQLSASAADSFDRLSNVKPPASVVARPSQASTSAAKATHAAALAASQRTDAHARSFGVKPSAASKPGGPASGTVHRVLRQVQKGTADNLSSRRKQDLVSRGLAKWDGPGKISLTDKGKSMIQEAEMTTTVEQAVREVLEAKAATRSVVCPSCGAKNTVDMEDVADGGKDEKAEGDKLTCSKCGKSLSGALGKAAKGKGTSISEAADSMAKASSPEPFSSSKTSNWVARGGGLPAYIQHIAHDLMEKRGKSESNAIQMAIGIVKNWASGKGNVDANTRAAASKAVAEWEALKAKSKAKSVAESVQVSMWEDAELAGTEREVIAEAEALCADTDRLLAIQEAADSKTTSDGDGPSNEGGIKVKCMACGKRGIPTRDSNCPNCGKSVASALAFAKRMKAKSKVAEAEEEPGPIERAIMEGLGNG